MNEIRVVIIDDEAWTRDTIKRMGKWRELHCRIVGEASDGHSGLECIRQLQPQIIITDMKMPGLDGARMLQELESVPLKPKVIVVSGYADYTYTRQALTSHAVDYLLKPIKEQELHRTLAACIEAIKLEYQADNIGTAPSLLHGVDKDWLQQYQNARDAARKSLNSLSSQGVEHALEQIGTLFSQCSNDKRLALLVKINHDLHALIEEEIIRGPGEEDPTFQPYRISFAVGEQKTAAEMLTHYLLIIEDLIASRVQEHQRRQRIDIRPICAFIDAHYQQTLTLDELAGTFSLSKEYLSALFRKELDCTFTEYVTRTRMEKARQLITEYRIPLKKVPEMVGYLDVPNFYRQFKRYFGTTPGVMRDSAEDSKSESKRLTAYNDDD